MSRLPLVLGGREFPIPVVLAPMAGVTNIPFRAQCRKFGPGLIYVSEMVMATALVHGNEKTQKMVAFGDDEDFRSLQIYGSDPDFVSRAVRQLCEQDIADHIDMNFGCPAHKVTRKGGGAAVPVKRNLTRAIMRAAVKAAEPYGVPITCKFRIGISDDLVTFLDTGKAAEDEGIAMIALHARTAEQHYAGHAQWDRIAELKQTVTSIPVLGNGDIWEASDAVAMINHTNCDGVVIGRGCLGKPWLFRDLVDVFSGREVSAAPTLGFVLDVMVEHAQGLMQVMGDDFGIRNFRKHCGWYLTGYPVGAEVRRAFSTVHSLEQLREIASRLDREMRLVDGGERLARGHTNGPIKVVLPDGYLDNRDDMTVPDDGREMALSGG
ncbi:MAG: tRNA-dihydrouridine synthase [Actinomycetota bacterium]|jgi:nifR3 family TIM-barrel protein